MAVVLSLQIEELSSAGAAYLDEIKAKLLSDMARCTCSTNSSKLLDSTMHADHQGLLLLVWNQVNPHSHLDSVLDDRTKTEIVSYTQARINKLTEISNLTLVSCSAASIMLVKSPATVRRTRTPSSAINDC